MGVRAEIGSIPALDGVRGIAVLWVIAFHYAVLRPEATDPWLQALRALPWLDAVVRNGYLGVELFFLLSGFLLALPWIAHHATGQPPPQRREFYGRRIRRIVPAYYVQLLLLFLIFAPLLRGGWDYWKRDLYVLAWNVFAHAGFLHTTSPLTSGSLAINGALWSLAVEAQFYLLLPLLAPLFVRAPFACTAAAFAIAGLWRHAAHHDLATLVAWQMQVGEHWKWSEETIRHLLATQMPAYLGHFALGALLAHAWMRVRERRPAGLAAGLAAAAGLAFVVFTLVTHIPLAGEQNWAPIAAALGASLFAAAFASGVAETILGRGPLAWAGRVSYSAYLYHLPLLLLWNHYAGALAPMLSAPLYLAVVMLAAWLSWRFIEARFWRESPR